MEMDKFMFNLQLFGEETLEGDYQLLWGENSKGLFAVSATSSTKDEITTWTVSGNIAIKEKAGKMTFSLPKSGTKYYLEVKNTYIEREDPEEGADAYNSFEVVGLWKATSSGATKVFPAEGAVGKAAMTLTAPAEALVFNTAEVDGMAITINNLAAESVIRLKNGDKATTQKLDAGDRVITGVVVENELVSEGSIPYVAATAGPLTFVGEDDGDSEEETALLTGNVMIKAEVCDKVYLAGSTRNAEDNTKVSTTDADGVVVKASNGKLTSVTGLNGTGKTVTVTEVEIKTVKGETTTTKTVYTYTAIDDEGTMIQREKSVTVDEGDPKETTEYVDIAAGKEIYSNKTAYKAAVSYAVGGLGEGQTVAYYYLGEDSDTAKAAANTALSADNTRSFSDGKFVAKAGEYYLKVTSSTNTKTTPPTTTISKVETDNSEAKTILKIKTGNRILNTI